MGLGLGETFGHPHVHQASPLWSDNYFENPKILWRTFGHPHGPSPERGESHHHGGRMRVGSARVGQGEGKESQVQGHKDVFTNVHGHSPN